MSEVSYGMNVATDDDSLTAFENHSTSLVTDGVCLCKEFRSVMSMVLVCLEAELAGYKIVQGFKMIH